MARTVKDAAIILGAIAGVDPKDNYTSAIPDGGRIPDYLAALNRSALMGARIGIPYNVLNLTALVPAEVKAWNEAVSLIASSGAVIVDANFTVPNATANSTVLGADFISDLAAYLAELTYNPYNITSLADLQNFTQTFPLEAWPDRDTATWDTALARGYGNTDGRFWAALQQNYYNGGPGGLLGAIERDKLDAVLLPTSQSAGRAAITGAPIVTVPLGFYPANESVVRNSRGLVTRGPKIP
jgi:amidase